MYVASQQNNSNLDYLLILWKSEAFHHSNSLLDQGQEVGKNIIGLSEARTDSVLINLATNNSASTFVFESACHLLVLHKGSSKLFHFVSEIQNYSSEIFLQKYDKICSFHKISCLDCLMSACKFLECFRKQFLTIFTLKPRHECYIFFAIKYFIQFL